MLIRSMLPTDEEAWRGMRAQLWPDSEGEDAVRWKAREDAVTLLAFDGPDGEPIGFAEAGERAYADGCDSSPVGFLEGWFVQPAFRRHGVGRSLVDAVGAWARSRGLTELASDTLLDDETAIRSHLSSGFEEVERSVKFRKQLF